MSYSGALMVGKPWRGGGGSNGVQGSSWCDGLKLMVCMMTMGLVGLMGQGPSMGGALALLFSTIKQNEGFCCGLDCSLLRRLKVIGKHTQGEAKRHRHMHIPHRADICGGINTTSCVQSKWLFVMVYYDKLLFIHSPLVRTHSIKNIM